MLSMLKVKPVHCQYISCNEAGWFSSSLEWKSLLTYSGACTMKCLSGLYCTSDKKPENKTLCFFIEIIFFFFFTFVAVHTCTVTSRHLLHIVTPISYKQLPKEHCY